VSHCLNLSAEIKINKITLSPSVMLMIFKRIDIAELFRQYLKY